MATEAYNPYGEVERQAAADEVLAPERTGGNSSSTGEQENDGANTPGAAGAAGGTAGISTKIPQEYTASSYAELIPQLEARMNDFRPPTKEEVAKIRRRQRAEGIISGISDAVRSVANLAYTTQYAPNMYDGSGSMSARARARFDRERAEREANDERYFNYAMSIGRLRDADKERGLRAWQTEQGLARQDRAYDDARRDRADDVAFRDRNYDRQGQWHKEEGERWERQFAEMQNQFRVNSDMERQRLSLSYRQVAQAEAQGQMTFNLGSGYGNVTLPMHKLNRETISRIFYTLPENVRAQVQGEPIYGPEVVNGVVQYGFDGKPKTRLVGHQPPTTDAMLTVIGAHVQNYPKTQQAIRQVAGQETGERPAGY